MDINKISKEIYDNAVRKGFYDNGGPSFPEAIALMHSELSEALEEYRDGHKLDEVYFKEEKPDKPEGVPTELADVIIRILDTCHRYNIPIEKIIAMKMKYNKSRKYKHGNKLL